MPKAARSGGSWRGTRNLLLDHLSLPLQLVENAVSQMAVFVRRRAIEAVGPLRTDLHWVLSGLAPGLRMWWPGVLAGDMVFLCRSAASHARLARERADAVRS